MEDVILISTATTTKIDNTRTKFENIIPVSYEKHFSCVCLKELYFQAKFVSVARQTRPHITFLIDRNTPGFQFSTLINASNIFALPISNSAASLDFEIVDRRTDSISPNRTHTTFPFGVCVETKSTKYNVVETTFTSTRFESLQRMIEILNFILDYHGLDVNISFSKSTDQKIEISCIDGSILIDQKFAEFLGGIQIL